MNKLKMWKAGYLHVELRGCNRERFINICNEHDIVIHNLNYRDNCYTGYIRLKDYKGIKPIVKKTGLLPIIIDKNGMPFMIDRVKKHISLAIAVIICCVIISFLGSFLWNIDVSGGNIHTESQIVNFLKEKSITAGMKTSKISCKSIEDFIREKYPDIGWVSAELNGTNLKIRINEVNKPVNTKKPVKKSSHIVAVKKGTVTDIVTRNGIPCVKKGDKVNPGDILVSGIVQLHDDSGNISENYSVIADADVLIKTKYIYYDKISRLHKTKIYTGAYMYGHEFWLLGNKIISYNYGNSYDKYDIITEVNNVRLFEDYYLPIRHASICLREYTEKDAYYPESACIEIASDNLEAFIDEIVSRGGVIISNRVIPKKNTDNIEYQGEIIVVEPAWEYVRINHEELEMNKTDEH